MAEHPDPAHGWRKACDSCHASKVRCTLEPLSPVGACQRCAKYGLRCTHSFRGARRKPAQTKGQRIAELERRVQMLIESKIADASAHSAQPQSSGPDSPGASAQGVGVALKGDAVDRGILTAGEAADLVTTFRANLEGTFLGTWLPRGVSDAHLRRSHPVLWLSLLCASAASRGWNMQQCRDLSLEMDLHMRTKHTLSSEPSLEMLRAAHIYWCHHYEPTYARMEQSLHYHYISSQMAVRLADIELYNPNASEDTKVDVSREVLCNYWTSMIVSTRTGTPPLPSYDRLVRQSLQVLENSQDRIDQSLIVWVSLARITLDAANLLDVSSGEGREEVMQHFEERLRQWMTDCPPQVLDDELLFEYNFTMIFISEIKAAPRGKDDCFRKPRNLPRLDDPHVGSSLVMPWNGQTEQCISAAHTMLDTFTSMEPERIRCIGITAFGRIFYALRFLFQVLYFVLAGAPTLVSVDSLKTEAHVEALVRCLERAADGAQCKAPTVWLYALQSRLLPWYRELCRRSNLFSQGSRQSGAMPGPMFAMSPTKGEFTPGMSGMLAVNPEEIFDLVL